MSQSPETTDAVDPAETVETRGDDRVDLLRADTNNDGRTDVWVFDTDGDGTVDVTMVDLDEDGTPDMVVDGDGGLPPEQLPPTVQV